ncbi:DEAD/DEAH box helicase [Corallococcus caeni]|uniref:AAA+ ATPase domain-containing protein n=1 Tax=Corallococcus caeni TaxID=3082388 RepID=A0ABQ6QTA8_9BACT|nr:hypothetical protein ASNO1_27760 [Corallococcus sp. NO1]
MNVGEHLARSLLDGREGHAFSSEVLGFEVVDTLVSVRVAQRTEVCLPGGRSYPIELKQAPALRRILEVCPHAVWVCGFQPKARSGSLLPFAPPGKVAFSTSVPFRIPEFLEEQAETFGLQAGQDALAHLGLDVGGRRVAVMGQRSIAALSEEDARTLTWWLPSGDVLETRLILEKGRAWFELRQCIAARDARSAACGPNTLVLLEPESALPIVHARDEASAAETEARVFLPPRSPLFDAWARYVSFLQEQGKGKQEARAATPLNYESASQHGRHWKARARLDEPRLRAWLGAKVQEGRWIKVDQPVRLEGRDEQGTLTVDKMKLKGPGLAELRLTPNRQVREIPSSGTLQAVENKGSKRHAERQREAVEILRAGSAACPRLLDILNAPGLTREPVDLQLPVPVQEQLDEHQRNALLKILGCQEMVAIQGPPGTGKTRVIVEALRQIAASRGRKQKPFRVLVSSVQNEAIDNVVERLESVQGIVVQLIQRAGRNEDEDFTRAERHAWGRARIIQALEERLNGAPIIRTLGAVDDVRAQLEQLRLLLMAGETTSEKAARAFENFARDEAAPFTPSTREQAHALAQALRSGPSPAQPKREEGAPARLPERAEELRDWWWVARETWPVDSRAEVEVAVTAVMEAAEGARENPLRWRRRVEGGWQELRRLVEARVTAGASRAFAEQRPEDSRGQRLEAWVKRAQEDLRHCAEGLTRTPDAVAFRFLCELRSDPAAWDAIKRRHGNTTAATCSMAAKARELDEEPYDWVIIDEAGRASPFELLIPMVQGRRIVLIGDHRQLPPMVEDELVDALEREQPPSVDIQRETLFGLVYSLLPASCRVRLKTQYRMHGDIGRLVNQLFYRPHKEELESHFSGPVLSQKRRPTWGVEKNQPVVWLDLPRNKDAVYSNPLEQQVVLELLEKYAGAAAEGSAPFVGVICAYSDQRDALTRALETRPELRAIATVRTIDSVQGREYPVVLFCTSRMDGKPGFLALIQRINVALSRAQRQLIILGNTGALSTQGVKKAAPHLGELVNYCQREKFVVSWEAQLA